MSQQGYIAIANIFGYTSFLNKTEIDHAQSIVNNLLNTLIENIKPPLVFSKIEGDSIFIYKPENGFIKGQTLIEAVENLYYIFALTRETMHRNTVCPCKACRVMTDLDLKFVFHYGTYSFTAVNGHQDIIGPDVMTVRNLSNSPIPESTGIKGFAFITDDFVKALEMEEFTRDLNTYSETCEHIGEIKGFVYDLHPALKVIMGKNEITVAPEDTWFMVDTFLPVNTTLAWEFITDPSYRRRWLKASKITLDGSEKGRIGIGTTYICAHGKHKINQVIVDWKPFDYLTVDTIMPLKGILRSTSKLTPDGNGTNISWRFERIKGFNGLHTFILRSLFGFMKGVLINRLKEGNEAVREMIDKEAGT